MWLLFFLNIYLSFSYNVRRYLLFFIDFDSVNVTF
jgi:hypothetical protein